MSSTNIYGGPPASPPPLNNSGPGRSPRTTSGAAIASLILGFFSMLFWVFSALPAIILALVAKSDIRANPTTVRGSGLATIGLVLGLAGLLVPFFWMFLFVGLLSGPSANVAYYDGQRIAHIRLAGTLLETPTENLSGLSFDSAESLKQLIERIERAAEDDSVEALLFTLGPLGLGMGQLEEIVQAIEAFKTSGKKVFAHGTALQTGSYALFSGVSQLNVVPTDTVWLAVMSLTEIHLKVALEKIVLNADFVKIW